MSFAPSEVILGATLPLENGSTITFSVAGHIETERDCDDAVVIFGRKLLKYTNSASDADRLTVRQVVASITSTPLDKVPDVGTPCPDPTKPFLGSLPKKQDFGKTWTGEADGRVLRLDEPAKVPAPVTLDQVSPPPERMPPLSKSEAGHLKSAEKTAADALGDLCKEPVKLSAPVQKQVESFGICDKCGEAVPKSQVKLSQLFTGKILCKDCMSEVNK